jgi:hypothetical protein
MSGKKKAPGAELAALNKKKLRSTDVSPKCGGGTRDQLPDLEVAKVRRDCPVAACRRS